MGIGRTLTAWSLLGILLAGGAALSSVDPAWSASRTGDASPAVQARQAGEDLAQMLKDKRPLEESFAMLRKAGLAFDADLAVATSFVRDCRRGRALSTLAGLYRADYAYAQAFGQVSAIPLRETLEQAGQSPAMTGALLHAWGVGGAASSDELRQALRTLSSMDEVRHMVDIFYGALLEQVHILCSGLLRLSPQQWQGASFAPAVEAVIHRLDAFRRVLQGWAASPALVRELGLHSDITLLDRAQADLEMLLLQPGPALAQAALDKVSEERESLARLCKAPPQEEKGRQHRLQLREDIFTPRNFF